MILGLNFTGKETDCETGLSYFGARYYDPTLLTSWTAIDPLADKYPSLSPYNYCAWNPMKLVDPDGCDTLIFNNKGVYTGSINAPGEHVGRLDCSPSDHIVFNFADPDNDPKDIKEGRIKHVEVVSDKSIRKTLENSDITKNKPILYINKLSYLKNHSNATQNDGKLDFFISANLSDDVIYIVNLGKEYYGHNGKNFGNFLWGASASILGVEIIDALVGAHINNYFNDPENVMKKWYERKFDSKDDQRSITQGYEWVRRKW